MNPQAAAKFCLTLAFTALSFGARPDALAQPVDIASWDFAGLGSYGASPLAPTTNAANVTVVGLTRGAGVSTTGTAAANAWGGTAWLGQADFNAAVAAGATASFSVAANTGFSLSLSSVSAYNVRRSSTGPTTGQWQYRVGGGAFVNIGGPITWGAVTTSAGNPQSAIDLSSIAALQNVAPGAVVEFRIVNYGASGTGTWYLNSLATVGPDFVITGTVGSSSPNAPTIASFSPTSGASGTTVTITGTNFTGATAVAFNSLSAASFSVVNATTITAVVPGGARTGRITVTTADGTATSSTDFIPLDGGGTVALQNGGAGAFSGKNLFGRSLSGQTVRLVYTPPATGTVEGLRVTVPAEFGVPASANVSVAGTGGAGAVVGVAGQVVTITGLSASSPNAINVDISALSTPDTSTSITNAGRYAFSVDSRGSGGTFAALSAQPSASVLIPLANARNADPTTFVPVLLNQLIAVEGVCVAGRLGSGATSTMLQDGNLGIALYSLSAVTGPQTRGNRYAAVGTVAQFNGVVQLALSDPALLVDLGAGLEPAPTTVSVTEFNANGVAYQSRVIRIENLSFVSGTWAVNQNVVLQDPSANQVTIRIQQNSTATTAPTFPATVTGIGGQFDTSSPFNSGFQLQPRDPADLTSATLPSISVNPASISNLTATQGNFGPSTNFVVNASNLSNNITVTANDAVNFAISTNNTDFTNTLSLPTNSSGAVSNASVFVRLTGASPGFWSNNVSLSSPGATTTNVAVSGTVLRPELSTTTTNITGQTAFQGSPSSAPFSLYTLTGTTITNSVNITMPSSLQVSTNAGATFSNSAVIAAPPGGVLSNDVLVRISPVAPQGLFTNFITNSTLGAASNIIVQVSGEVVLSNTPTIFPGDGFSLTGFTTVRTNASTNQQITVSGTNLSAGITISVPSGWQVSATNTNNFSTSNITLPLTPPNTVAATPVFVRLAGTNSTATNYSSVLRLISGTRTNNINLSGSVTDPPPVLTPSTNALSGFSTVAPSPSTNQSFTLSGSNLTANVTLTPPPGWQISATNATSFGTNAVVLLTNAGGLLPTNTIFVRLAGTNTSATNYSGSALTISSGATNASVLLSGSVTLPPPALSATPSALTGFATVVGYPSSSQPFTVVASDLTTNLTVSPPSGWEVSFATNSGFGSSLILTNSATVITNIVFIRMAAGSVVTNYTTNNTFVTISNAAVSANVRLAGTNGAAPFVDFTPTALSGFVTYQGTASTNQIVDLSASTGIAAPGLSLLASAGWEISTNATSGFTNSLLFAQSSQGNVGARSIYVRIASSAPVATNPPLSGALTFSNGPFSAAVTLNGTVRALPGISVAPSSLTGFDTAQGLASTNQSFNVIGSNLENPVTITAPSGYEISTNASSGFTTNLTVTPATSSLVASDNAGNYGTGWNNGANGGFGFGAWSFSTGGNAGGFIGNPSSGGISGMSTESFGLYANPTNAGNFINVDRSLSTAMQVGNSFSFQWGVNFDAGGPGNKGFNLYVGTNQVINVNMAGSETITINGTNTGFGYGSQAMTWSFFMSSATNLAVTANDRDGSGTYSNNFAITGGISSFRWYASQLDSSSFTDQRQPYFNNLSISNAGGGGGTPIFVRIAATAPVTNNLAGTILLSSAFDNGARTATNSVSLSGIVWPRPGIAFNPSTGLGFYVTAGYEWVRQLTVTGTALQNNISVALTNPATPFLISTDPEDPNSFGTSLVLTNNNAPGVGTSTWTVYVALTGDAPQGPLSENLVFTTRFQTNTCPLFGRVGQPQQNDIFINRMFDVLLYRDATPAEMTSYTALLGGTTNVASNSVKSAAIMNMMGFASTVVVNPTNSWGSSYSYTNEYTRSAGTIFALMQRFGLSPQPGNNGATVWPFVQAVRNGSSAPLLAVSSIVGVSVDTATVGLAGAIEGFLNSPFFTNSSSAAVRTYALDGPVVSMPEYLQNGLFKANNSPAHNVLELRNTNYVLMQSSGMAALAPNTNTYATATGLALYSAFSQSGLVPNLDFSGSPGTTTDWRTWQLALNFSALSFQLWEDPWNFSTASTLNATNVTSLLRAPAIATTTIVASNGVPLTKANGIGYIALSNDTAPINGQTFFTNTTPLPAWATLTPDGYVIGTPTAAGAFTSTVTAQNIAGSSARQIVLQVAGSQAQTWMAANYPGNTSSLYAFRTNDTDGDGFNTAAEYAFGSNPNVPNASIMNFSNLSASVMRITWNGLTNQTYTLQVSTNLVGSPAWTNRPNALISTNGPLINTNGAVYQPLRTDVTNSGASNVFYRIWTEFSQQALE